MSSKCPLCGGNVVVTSFKCTECGSKVEGQFTLNEFSSLSKQDLDFLREYLKNRGNLTKVAEKLGISYPTAHSYFNRLLRNLGYISSEEEKERVSSISEVLNKLESGEYDFSMALSILKKEVRGK
ncbi:DUF2089 domain-containing protein [Pseudothermotoga thermarum]|nr:DUF2089 domain-containing protein [Pseudothermotoga thermarum]